MRAAIAVMAGIAAILAAVMFVAVRDNWSDAPRTSELVALGPIVLSDALEFRWGSPYRDARYRVVVKDSSGIDVIAVERSSSPLALDHETRLQLKAGETYHWQVQALDAAGEITAASQPVTFRYQP